MKMLRLWLLCLVLAIWTPAECSDKQLLFSNEICYGELGCFNTKSPFWSLQRPITVLPANPEKINTRFFLFTRDNPDVTFELTHTNVTAGNSGPFKAGLPTKFIVHGFLESASYPWMRDMRSAFLRKAAMNVIIIDWSGGNMIPYTQATANTQVVGAEIARLVKALNQFAGLRLSDVHVLGHSLGAHIAGYAGQHARTIGRITGLDPADRYFQNTDPSVRLDPTDAEFVDVIHTDGSGVLALGLIEPVGHLDFYPNGGFDQPGCKMHLGKLIGGIMGAMVQDYEGFVNEFGCSHVRSIVYFTESIEATSCRFMAYPCASNEDFMAGKCLSCAGGSCPQMGFNADQFRGANDSYYLQTSAASPFCNYPYSVALSTGPNKCGMGTVQLKLVAASGTIDDVRWTNGDDVDFKPHSTYPILVPSSKDLGAIQRVAVKFQKTSNWLTGWLYPDNVEIDFVTVIRGESQQQSKLCTTNAVIRSGSSGTYTSC